MTGVIVAMSYPSLAPQGWPGSRAGRDDPLSQERIDEAVVQSLQTVTLPSMAARAAQILAPSVVRVRSFGPPEEEGSVRDAPRRDEKRDGSNRDSSGGGQTSPNRDSQREQGDAPADVPRDGGREVQRDPQQGGGADPQRNAQRDNGKNGRRGQRAPREDVQNGVGTGVVIKDDGLILSNLHVVAGARRITVVFADGSESEAVVTGARPEHDLAVLKAKKIPDDLQPATLRSTGDLSEGDGVIVIGFPFDIGPSVSSGVISGFNREYRSTSGERILTNLIQFDAAANPGNSGGPLATMEGEVVGIVTAILNPNNQRSFVGIGFAVPIENAAAAAGLPPH